MYTPYRYTYIHSILLFTDFFAGHEHCNARLRSRQKGDAKTKPAKDTHSLYSWVQTCSLLLKATSVSFCCNRCCCSFILCAVQVKLEAAKHEHQWDDAGQVRSTRPVQKSSWCLIPTKSGPVLTHSRLNSDLAQSWLNLDSRLAQS